jgi:hypothetical protein
LLIFFLSPFSVSDELESDFLAAVKQDQSDKNEGYKRRIRESVDSSKVEFRSSLERVKEGHHTKVQARKRAYRDFVETSVRQERLKFLLEATESTHYQLLDMHDDLFGSLAQR